MMKNGLFFLCKDLYSIFITTFSIWLNLHRPCLVKVIRMSESLRQVLSGYWNLKCDPEPWHTFLDSKSYILPTGMLDDTK